MRSASSRRPAVTPARPFDALLCDLDNVIRFYDTTRLAALERAAGLPVGTTASVAFAPEVDLPLLLGRTTRERWAESVARALAGGPGVPCEQARELGAALAGAPFRADGEVVSLLRRAREHLPVVLVTNASLGLEEDLAAMGLEGLAHHVVNSALVGVAKPDPEIYGIAVERAGVPAGRCLFVDDRRENVEAAAALGMGALHYRAPADLRGALAFLPAGPAEKYKV
ncbi:HAD family hydrolase [Streptomyces desertarenae]|uniref:HAD family hydrolase n=1 Tax=Streptomyces desertarenae TaxID=2666184 RepID=A0ABW4PDQ5_9ACTN